MFDDMDEKGEGLLGWFMGFLWLVLLLLGGCNALIHIADFLGVGK